MLWSEFDRRGQIRFGQNLLRERRAPAGFRGRNHFLFIGSAKALQFCYSDLNKLYQKWYNIYCIFRGDHDLINLLCLIVCRYKSFFFFFISSWNAIWYKETCFRSKAIEWSRYSCSRDWYTVSLLKMSRFIFVLCGSRRYDMLWMFNKHCMLSLRRSKLVSVHVA